MLLNFAPSKLYRESSVMIMRDLRSKLVDLIELNKALVSLNAL